MLRCRRTIIVISAAALIAMIVGVVHMLRSIERDVHEAYALKRTNYLLIDYVSEYDGRWPDSWDDLVPVAEEQYPGSGESQVAELRELVGINWDLDIDAFLQTDGDDDRSAFRTTYLLSGSTFHWSESTKELYFGILAALRVRENS